MPLPSESVDAVYARMLLCTALSTAEIRALVAEIRRVLRPGGVLFYTVRHTGDAHYGAGIDHGDDSYEHSGFAVHFFSRRLVDDLAADWKPQQLSEFEVEQVVGRSSRRRARPAVVHRSRTWRVRGSTCRRARR